MVTLKKAYYNAAMGGRRLQVADLTSLEVDSLSRETTLFVMTLSPMEVHGPHLPLGTDVWVAEEVRERALEKIGRDHPELDFALFPSYYLGSDTIAGSMEVGSRAVYLVVLAAGAFLAARGFHWLLVLDNHGGPRHQIAMAKAVRRLYQRDGFHVVAPFLSFYRRMVELDPLLLERLEAGPGACGDAQDCHAGSNETSLMLCAMPDKVRDEWKSLPRRSINTRRWPSVLLGTLGRTASALGWKELGNDLAYVGTMLSWVTEKNPPNYIGHPAAASPRAGERMLDAFADEALARTEAALRGEPPFHRPLGWSLRFLEPSR